LQSARLRSFSSNEGHLCGLNLDALFTAAAGFEQSKQTERKLGGTSELLYCCKEACITAEWLSSNFFVITASDGRSKWPYLIKLVVKHSLCSVFLA
jgi:hypothetical protein